MKLDKLGGGGGASEIRQAWGGACPKRLKTPALNNNNYVSAESISAIHLYSTKNCLKHNDDMIFHS